MDRTLIAQAALALSLMGCVSAGGGLDKLPAPEKQMFVRCSKAVENRLCGNDEPTARAKCMKVQAGIFAARRSTKMRRNWLALNECPAAVIDAPDEPIAETAETIQTAEAPPAPAAPAPAAPTLPTLVAAGGACRRSAECASDLCVKGSCVALASLTVGKVSAEPAAEPASAQARPAAAEPVASATVAAPVEAPPPRIAAEDEPVEALAIEEAAAPLLEGKDKESGPIRQRAPAGTSAPRLGAGPAGDQLRGAIVQHEAEMKKCVERQLKLVPELRAEGTLVLEVNATGRVTQAGLRGERLQGTPLEGCLRTIAARWVFPRTARAYAVEAPLKISGVESARP